MGGNGNLTDYPQNQIGRQAGITLIDKYMIRRTQDSKKRLSYIFDRQNVILKALDQAVSSVLYSLAPPARAGVRAVALK
jgi:hypothetical protein